MSPNKKKAPTIVHDKGLKKFQTEDKKHYAQYQISSTSKEMEIVNERSSKRWIDPIYKAIRIFTKDKYLIKPIASCNSGQSRVEISGEEC